MRDVESRLPIARVNLRLGWLPTVHRLLAGQTGRFEFQPSAQAASRSCGLLRSNNITFVTQARLHSPTICFPNGAVQALSFTHDWASPRANHSQAQPGGVLLNFRKAIFAQLNSEWCVSSFPPKTFNGVSILWWNYVNTDGSAGKCEVEGEMHNF